MNIAKVFDKYLDQQFDSSLNIHTQTQTHTHTDTHTHTHTHTRVYWDYNRQLVTAVYDTKPIKILFYFNDL